VKRFFFILFLVFFIGCSEHDELPHDEIPKEKIIFQNFLEKKGYQVVSYEGRVNRYELTKQKMIELPYMQDWGVQSVDPSQYFGKTIHVEKFIVKNHPLSKLPLFNGKVDVFVFEVDGKPIGGISFPHASEALDGASYSLEGKTIEEIHHKSFQEWRTEWVNKYAE
jgi:hypothetical protein